MSSCSKCIFYSPSATTASSGECRESPPKAFLVPMRNMSGEGMGFHAVFPTVNSATWCGAFVETDDDISKLNLVSSHMVLSGVEPV